MRSRLPLHCLLLSYCHEPCLALGGHEIGRPDLPGELVLVERFSAHKAGERCAGEILEEHLPSAGFHSLLLHLIRLLSAGTEKA